MVKLLSVTTHGIKNIESDITLDFVGKNTLKDFKFDGNNVKAVYGSNGSGKTAFISSFLFAKQLMLNRNFLANTPVDFLDSLINNKTKEFYFRAVFECLRPAQKTHQILAYSLVVSKTNGKYRISKETIESIEKNDLGSAGKILLLIRDGAVVHYCAENEAANALKGKTMNLLGDSTIVSLVHDLLFFNTKEMVAIDPMPFDEIRKCASFALNLFVCLDENGLHDDYFPAQWFSANYSEGFEAINCPPFVKDGGFTRARIRKSDLPIYEEYIKKLAFFISIFKPELKGIRIAKKENEGFFFCSNVFVYDGYSIDEEYESTGIKKLSSLFKYLNYASEGAIVLVDEIDSNLTGVFLTKLIEYMLSFGKGQLCFTAHNTEPMVPLSKLKKSIYFIGENNEFFPWIKNGNYKPYNLYPEGMIRGIPFNIENFDFLTVFGGE